MRNGSTGHDGTDGPRTDGDVKTDDGQRTGDDDGIDIPFSKWMKIKYPVFREVRTRRARLNRGTMDVFYLLCYTCWFDYVFRPLGLCKANKVQHEGLRFVFLAQDPIM